MKKNTAAAKAAPRPVGYLWLIERFELSVLPCYHQSLVWSRSRREVHHQPDCVEDYFPQRMEPGNTLGEQLEFAIEHDGIDLGILTALFQKTDPNELAEYIKQKPLGRNTRRIWYLYEFLTEELLPLDDLTSGGYFELLDSKRYYTSGSEFRRIRRQRVLDNLLGTAEFCPIVRRTEKLAEYETIDFGERLTTIASRYNPDLQLRASNFLYLKETKSSFDIEREVLDESRTERFVGILKQLPNEDLLSSGKLIDLQHQIVDPRFAETDYRAKQNYVGESIDWGREKIHYIPPPPGDLHSLMNGIFDSHRRMSLGGIHPVIHATVVAYGFVYMHPFEDGNGRIHRLLIHNVLGSRGFTPYGTIFPVSAAMLLDMRAYDRSLESFSAPLMRLPNLSYRLNEDGEIAVEGNEGWYYRYMDMTHQVEAMFGFITSTIDDVFVSQLDFLSSYDQARHDIQRIVDLPNPKLSLFIKICGQNHGRLASSKRKRLFSELTDDEIARMERAFREAFDFDEPDED